MQEFKQTLTKKQHEDAPMIMTKLNQWLKVNKDKFQENDVFEIGMFYPEAAKKILKLKPSLGEITIQPFKLKIKGVPEDLVLINVYKMRGSVFAFANRKEFFNGNVTSLQFTDLRAPTLDQWKQSYHQNARCREFLQTSILDLASQMISLYEKGQIPNLQEVLCDMLWSFIGRETEEIPQQELKIFIDCCFGLMFAEFEMFEELEEWLPGDIYNAVSEKLHACQNVFQEHLTRGIKLIKNPRMMKLLQIISKLSYENGQFETIDEPILLGASMDGNTEPRFNRFWRKCGGEVIFE